MMPFFYAHCLWIDKVWLKALMMFLTRINSGARIKIVIRSNTNNNER
jgi:hypothetical protein